MECRMYRCKFFAAMRVERGGDIGEYLENLAWRDTLDIALIEFSLHKQLFDVPDDGGLRQISLLADLGYSLPLLE